MSIFFTSNKRSSIDKEFYLKSKKRQIIIEKVIKKSKLKKFFYNKTSIYLINDTKQFLGSYKIRGATSKFYDLKKSNCKSICLASTGNFGLSISYLSKKYKIECKVFVSKNTAKNKIDKLIKFGADIDATGNTYDDAKEKAKKYSKKNKVKFIDVCSKEIFYGNASLTLEALENIELKDRFFLEKKILAVYPLGSGSLATPGIKILKYINKKIDVAVVEPKNFCKLFYKFTKRDKPNFKKSIAEGASVRKIPKINYSYLLQNINIVSHVSESDIKKSIKYLFKNFNIKSEGAGALTAAFFLKYKKIISKYDSVILPICGSNIDQKIFSKIIY